ncbi:MAG: DMT family transporter, partial [Pseudomonadota bacterium]
MSSPSLRTELPLLGLLAILWGSSYVFLKVAVAEIPPVTLIALRVLGATIFLLLVMGVRSENLPRDLSTWRMLLLQAFLNSIGAWTVLAWGQQYVASGLASVLNSTSPIFVFFITALVTRHEALDGRKLVGAVLGLLGVVLIVGVDALRGLGDQVAGQLACLFSAGLYAGAAIYGKRFGHISAVASATGTMIWASIVL